MSNPLRSPSVRRVRRFACSTGGASMHEFTIVVLLFVTLIGMAIDFSWALYQWNAASKALYQGARLASTSDPVSSDLSALTGLEGGANPGDPFPNFTRVCSGASASCTGGTYSATAMNTLIYGRGQTTCGSLGADGYAGMCDVFARVRPQNVIVTYQQTGLGFAGRPGGPVPTITLELTGLTFNFIFLRGILGLGPITMPPMRTTATAEDMKTAGN